MQMQPRRTILYKPKVKNPSSSSSSLLSFFYCCPKHTRKCCQSVYAILHIDNNFQLQALGGACATCVFVFLVVFVVQSNSIELVSLLSPAECTHSLSVSLSFVCVFVCTPAQCVLTCVIVIAAVAGLSVRCVRERSFDCELLA